MNQTSALRFNLAQPNWNSTYMSSIAGAAAYFGLKYSAPELCVESSYFAAINIQRALKPCGPYCWDHGPVARNLESMGIRVNWLHSSFDCESSDYREHLLEQICALGTDTVVCMVGLEFQLMCRRDENKLVFTLPWGPDASTCVRELTFDDFVAGKCFAGTAWFIMSPTTILHRSVRIQNSLDSAIAFYEESERPDGAEYFFGPHAWPQWVAKLESGSYDKHGHWWNSMVWGESRRRASEYFAQNWVGDTVVGESLSKTFLEISDLVMKSANKEISDLERADFIRHAQALEAHLSDSLKRCKRGLNTNKRN